MNERKRRGQLRERRDVDASSRRKADRLIKLEIERSGNGVLVRKIEICPGEFRREVSTVFELEDGEGQLQADKVIEFLEGVMGRLQVEFKAHAPQRVKIMKVSAHE